jgi:hypothetical protein
MVNPASGQGGSGKASSGTVLDALGNWPSLDSFKFNYLAKVQIPIIIPLTTRSENVIGSILEPQPIRGYLLGRDANAQAAADADRKVTLSLRHGFRRSPQAIAGAARGGRRKKGGLR